MTLEVTCPACDKTLKLKDELAGKKIRCPACSTVIPIPAEDDIDGDLDEEALPVRKRRAVKDEFDDVPDSPPRSRKSTKKKKPGRANSAGTNWWLIGGLTGGGLVLFVAMLVASINHVRNPASNRAEPSANWPTFRHPTGFAQIDMPGTPKFNAQQSVGGSQTYILAQRDFQVSLTAVPLDSTAVTVLASNPAAVDLMFNEIQAKGPLQAPGARLISTRRMSAGSIPGLEMKLDIQGNINLMRFYVVPKALIGAEFITRNETTNTAARERFFNSFQGPDGKLIDGPAPPPGVSPASSPAVAPTTAYLERLANFKTKLTRQGPSPQPHQREVPPPGVKEVTYQSGPLTLKAWVAFPKAAAGAKVPGVLYFHGGFAFGADDFKDAVPFLNAGYAVMCPTLRGENGNPGNFELYLAEVEDAKAAITWLASQERIDASHLYTFGHSAGGVISGLLSLHDVPIRHGGSSGGLYGTSLFDQMADIVPFDVNDLSERQLRVLVGNINWMKRPHYAYTGIGDTLQEVAQAQNEIKNGQPLLKVLPIPGDHHTSLKPAVAAYAKMIQDNP